MKRNHFSLLPAGRRLLALAVVLFALAARHALAQASFYINNAYTVNPSPTPDATNFVNNNVFGITDTPNILYQTYNTLNYTNTDYMYSVYGFYFDDYSTSSNWNYVADNFDNENTIECYDQLLVWATNVVDPGDNYVDNPVGLMQFGGNTVNLNNTLLQFENSLEPGAASVVSVDYGVGTATIPWSPFNDLTATSAQSEPFSTQLVPAPLTETLDLPDSTCYFDVNDLSTNAAIIEAVFVEDVNPAVSHNVYFSPVTVNTGTMTVGWSGVYTNIATGQTFTNYLYLTDQPALILSNGVNIVTINGTTPDNYTIQGSATPLYTGPTPEGFSDVFIPGLLTNNYSYLEAQLMSTTVSTNLVGTNVSAIGGRIEITATNELQLANAQISGENYLSLTSTNEFDGANGTTIAAPYSSLDLGVTNGKPGGLVVSNLLEQNIPYWSGYVEAWSTRWTQIYTNTIGTNSFAFTNDYRVELVYDDVAPTTPGQVLNLALASSNSVQISDALNVFGNLLINTPILTLTTNGVGNGAESEEGTLNLENDNILWPSALPNLRWLTNNGVINIGNEAIFGAAAPTLITNITPAVPAVAAMGRLSEVAGRTNVLNTNKVTIGSFTYTFVKTVNNSITNEIKLAPTFAGSMSNLIAAINDSTVAGKSAYSTKTVANTWASAGVLSNGAFVVTAITNGVSGNSIATTTTSTNLSWSTNTLVGGVNAIPAKTNILSVSGPYGAFVNNGMITDYGSQIYANYFENSGLIDNVLGPFMLTSTTAVFTNGELWAYYPFPPAFTNGFSGDISITASSNLVISGTIIEAGGGLTLQVTNSLSDGGVSNGNLWYLDGGSSLLGLNLPQKPAFGSLLGTTVEMFTPAPNKPVKNYWSGLDEGVSVNGYTNNAAIGQLILNVTTPNSAFNFSGPPGSTTSNAIYVDRLVLENYASYANAPGTANIPTLLFNTNLVIYYADALATETANGGPLEDVSYELNGFNANHLRWVPEYTGYFSTTSIVYPDGSVHNVNIGLASSPYLDSNGDGIPNAEDPYPIFVWSQINFYDSLTTNGMLELVWNSVPGATNYILATTTSGSAWNSTNWMILTNLTFTCPPYIPPTNGWPITNTLLITPAADTFYRVRIDQDTSVLYGQ